MLQRWVASPEGKRLQVFNAKTGKRLPTPLELEAARKAAEEKALTEAGARKAAEAELKRLRAEIERLKKPGAARRGAPRRTDL